MSRVRREAGRGAGMGARVAMVGVLLVIGCAPSDGVVARSALLAVHASGPRNQRTLRLDAAPGARINARLPPRLERPDAPPSTFGAGAVSVDSAYFTASPTATINIARPGTGTVRASVCPASHPVCVTVTLDVPLQ